MDYIPAGDLRPGDVFNGWARLQRFRVVEIGEHAIVGVVKIIGEDVETGDRHAFEFYRVNRVELGEDPNDV